MRWLTLLCFGAAVVLLALQVADVLSVDTAGWVAVAAFVGGATATDVLKWPRRQDELPGWLELSDDAREFVQFRGNRLYVWSDAFGGGFGRLTCDTSRPPDLGFDEVLTRPIRLYLAPDVPRKEICIHLRRFPHERLTVDRGSYGGDGGGG